MLLLSGRRAMAGLSCDRRRRRGRTTCGPQPVRGVRMLYAAYEAQRVTLDGARAASRAALESLDLLPPPIADLDPVRRLRAAHQVFVDSAITHERLPFGIDKVGVETPAGVRAVAVHEQA